MNKNDLIGAVADSSGLTRNDATKAVEGVFEAISGALKKGDEVATTGGLIGRISGLDENVVTLEVQEKVRVKVLRASVTGKAPGAAKSAAASETEKK